MRLSDLPPVGQPLSTGIFAGVISHPDSTHHAVVLLPDSPTKDVDWQQATDWAALLDATLPSRSVAALLFANLKPQFEKRWHWTCEEYEGSYAWNQSFSHGYQVVSRKSFKGRARAVRLIHLIA